MLYVAEIRILKEKIRLWVRGQNFKARQIFCLQVLGKTWMFSSSKKSALSFGIGLCPEDPGGNNFSTL